jgi:hypothetical protein
VNFWIVAGAEQAASAVENHLAELPEVVRGGEDAGLTRHPSHVARRWIVHYAAQQRAVLQHLGRRNARNQCRRGKIAGLFHAQRIEDHLPHVFVLGQAAQAVHDLAQQNEVDVAVDELRFRRIGRLVGERAVIPVS